MRLASRRLALGVDDLVEVRLHLGQRVLGRLALEVAQLVDRAPLHRRLAPHRRERPPQPRVAVDDAEHRRSEAALDQAIEKSLPRFVRLAPAHLQRNELLLSVGEHRQRYAARTDSLTSRTRR